MNDDHHSWADEDEAEAAAGDSEQICKVLRSCGVDEPEARRRSTGPSAITLVEATAIKIMIERRPRLNRTGCYAVQRIKDKSSIEESAIREAERRLSAKPVVKSNPQEEAQSAARDDARVEACIASLDDAELAARASEVLAKYQGNAAVLSVLQRKPPRECRLMRLEIAAMVDNQFSGGGVR